MRQLFKKICNFIKLLWRTVRNRYASKIKVTIQDSDHDNHMDQVTVEVAEQTAPDDENESEQLGK